MATKMAELEAILYVAGDEGINEESICNILSLTTQELEKTVEDLQGKLDKDENSGLQLIKINHTVKLVTSSDCSNVISQYFQKDSSKNLSQSALEILSIIAYEQPITRIEIDDIRGVNSSGAIQTLVWRGLIKVDGKKDVPGHPNLYVTTDYFLQYFDYSSLSDLPLIESFSEEEQRNEEVNLFDIKDKDRKERE